MLRTPLRRLTWRRLMAVNPPFVAVSGSAPLPWRHLGRNDREQVHVPAPSRVAVADGAQRGQGLRMARTASREVMAVSLSPSRFVRGFRSPAAARPRLPRRAPGPRPPASPPCRPGFDWAAAAGPAPARPGSEICDAFLARKQPHTRTPHKLTPYSTVPNVQMHVHRILYYATV